MSLSFPEIGKYPGRERLEMQQDSNLKRVEIYYQGLSCTCHGDEVDDEVDDVLDDELDHGLGDELDADDGDDGDGICCRS